MEADSDRGTSSLLAELIFATDQSDDDVALEVFEMLGTNHAIWAGTATVEEFLEKAHEREFVN